MVLASTRNMASILGMVVVVNSMSNTERLIRKKNMGLWSIWSTTTTVMMMALPTRISR